MKLTENKILITGGNKGIGLALAQKFESLGNRVIITGRNENDLAAVQKTHSNIISFRCDLTIEKEFNGLVEFIKTEHSDLNILINNAGVQYNYLFRTEPGVLSKIEYETQVNFVAPLKLVSTLLPVLEEQDNAAIVNVSSALSIVPKNNAPVYCANKAGIHLFSKVLRAQLAQVKVFEIIPSLVDTSMTKGRGKGKISPEQLANEFVHAFEKDIYEVNIGKVKLLRLIHRLSPRLARKIINGK